jgi:tRNA uridine 5-carboxymethylaminomethyl modification enzyme
MHYDVIVVGGGHAGVEAALASARMGHKTALLSMLAENVGATSCNPAVGGLAKGHLVKEVDALGGEIGMTTDAVGIQFRVLNETKGPAVRGTRAQIDMDKYRVVMRNLCLNTDNLELVQETVEEIIVEDGVVSGVTTELMNTYHAKRVIITAGTFLGGIIHVGERKISGGRFGELASVGLSENLRAHGLDMSRLKTGTCPRIDAASIDFSVMEAQEGDQTIQPFSFRSDVKAFQEKPQLPCYITYTNVDTHSIIADNFYRAPLFSGQIEGVGPRYCPSIEDKINRFADKDRHHLFIEPQTGDNTECYINGMSTSLPPDVQRDMIHSIVGMENARIVRYGYAIEYDYINPLTLKHTLETKKIKNLYMAGQINGTTGYEEAAAQGIMAGINACLSLEDKEPFILRRDEAYIGVLIDDLVTKGTKEPYRMFTSRAEFRLLLREDNADIRLSAYGHQYGLLDDASLEAMKNKDRQIQEGLEILKTKVFTPNKEFISFLETINEDKITDKMFAMQVVARKSFTVDKLTIMLPEFEKYSDYIQDQILIEAKYYRYIEKQQSDVDRMRKWIQMKIPAELDFTQISGLSKEIQEKLKEMAPPTLQAASQISGVTPAAVEILQIYLKVAQKQASKAKEKQKNEAARK